MRYAASTTLLMVFSGYYASAASVDATIPQAIHSVVVPEPLESPQASAIPKVIKDHATRVATGAEVESVDVEQASSQFIDDVSPRFRFTADSTGEGKRGGDAAQPHGTDGTYYGTSISERMLDIRKRAVDKEISRPFLVTEKTVARETVKDLTEQLPEVSKRSIVETGSVAAKLLPEPMVEDVPQQSSPVTGAAEASDESETPVASRAPAPSQRPVAAESEQRPRDAESVEITSEIEAFRPSPIRTPVVLPTRPIPQSSPAFTAAPRVTQSRRNAEPARRSGPEVLLSKHAPSLSFETAGPRTITVGKEASYRVSIVNTGRVDARNLMVTVSIPPWSDVTGQRATTGHAQLESSPDQKSLIRWDVGSLPADGQQHLTIRVIPRKSRPFNLAVGWTFSPGDSVAQIEVQEPLLEMSIDGPSEVLYGNTKTYVITLHNPGTGNAENVVLNLMPVTSSQRSAGARGIGVLKAGERKQIELELTAQEAGHLEVKAHAFADGGLRAEGSRKVLVRRARLQIVATGPPMKYAGTPADYKVSVENAGDAAAETVFVTAALPPATRFLSATEGGVYDEEAGRVVWQVGPMGARASRNFGFQCVLMRGGENAFTIHAQDDGDLQMTDTIVTSIEALADLKLYVNDPEGAVPVGSDATYEVKVVNRGTKAAENVQITGYFSRGVEPLAVRGWQGEIDKGQVVFEPIGRLNAGQELVFHINARADRPGNHVFRAEVKCVAPETRLAAEEWTKYYGDEVPYQAATVQGNSSPATRTRDSAVDFRR